MLKRQQEGGWMKSGDREDPPVTVRRNSDSKQAGDIYDRWSWAEPCVWTKLMLTALEQGVK